MSSTTLLFCPKSNDLYPTYVTLLPSSQLTTNIHWPCYCTVDVFVVIHFVTVSRMWSLLMEAIWACFYCLFIYVLPLVIQLSREKGWDPLVGLIPPHGGPYPRPIPGFPTYIVVLFFVFSEWRWEVTVRFVDIGGTVDYHCLNFLFIICMPGYKNVT